MTHLTGAWKWGILMAAEMCSINNDMSRQRRGNRNEKPSTNPKGVV